MAEKDGRGLYEWMNVVLREVAETSRWLVHVVTDVLLRNNTPTEEGTKLFLIWRWAP